MFPLLIGIVLAALVFAAMLWSVYRAVTTQGRLRLTYVILVLSTILIMAAITWNLAAVSLCAGLTGTVSGAIAVVADKRWNKLLPLIQVVLGLLSIGAGVSILF